MKRFFRIFACAIIFCILASGCGARDDGPAFDVPALLGKNIDEVSAILGAPSADNPNESGAPQRVWDKGGKTLTVTWKPSSKRVVDFALIARADENALSEEEKAKLLSVGQLPENDARYSLEWIEAKERPLFYVGARVVPAPQTHNVVLKLTGSEALVKMSYQPAPATGGAIVDLLPREFAFTAPDDTHISLAAELEKNLGRVGVFEMKGEIRVDGKLVKEATSKGLPLALDYDI